ncbi:MAG: hypothetical protein DHS20C02_18600 [Micavibrio sp.]|nr:MAG: hypothetical protein DHS20C02_18600 [Micavibrio sp.]
MSLWSTHPWQKFREYFSRQASNGAADNPIQQGMLYKILHGAMLKQHIYPSEVSNDLKFSNILLCTAATPNSKKSAGSFALISFNEYYNMVGAPSAIRLLPAHEIPFDLTRETLQEIGLRPCIKQPISPAIEKQLKAGKKVLTMGVNIK